MTNTEGVGEAEFRARIVLTVGGYVLGISISF
jgi:hypothetical protein